MPRRKTPQTSQEIKAEQEHLQEKIRQLENREKVLRNAHSKEERTLRTRRLCQEAGILEHFVPELKGIPPELAGEFIQTIATGQDATDFLRKRGIRTE